MIQVGVIGAGSMGLQHARVYSGLPGIKLCAICDVDNARANAAAAKFGTSPETDYHTMLKRRRLDAVSVVVPTTDHYEVAMEVIASGVNLLVEKPLATNVARGEDLVQAARRAGVKLAVGHIERFNPAVQELKRRVDAGMLGAISSVVAKRVGVIPPRVKDANVILDLAVHDIDILNYLFQKMPDYIAASAGRVLLADRFDHAEIFLRYGGAGCFVLSNWITPLKIRTLSVTGDSGHAELNYVTQKLEFYSTNVAREYDDFGDFVVRFGEAGRQVIQLDMVEPLRAEIENFLDAIVNGSPLLADGEVGVSVLRVVEEVLSLVSAEAKP